MGQPVDGKESSIVLETAQSVGNSTNRLEAESATNRGMQSVLPSKQKSAYSVPQSIGQKLVDLRGLISRFVVSQSLIILAIWLLAAFWTFGVLDYLPPKFGAAESPRAVRIVMLAIDFFGIDGKFAGAIRRLRCLLKTDTLSSKVPWSQPSRRQTQPA